MLTRLSDRIALNISKNINCDDEKQQVIAYGILAMLHTFVFLLCIVIIGIIFKILVPILIVCLSAALLKRSSGGAHADTPFFCSFIGSIVCFLQTYLAILINKSHLSIVFYIIFTLISFLVALYSVYKWAPVESPNKPINTERKRKKLRKISFITLIIYAILIAFFILIGMKNNRYNLYSICICFGLLWQSFMMTQSGQRFIESIEKFFSVFKKERS